MTRERAISLLATGEKVLHAYDGASRAWEGASSIKTGAETLSQIRSGSEIAITGIFVGIMFAILR